MLPVRVADVPRVATGGARLKEKNKLPKVFLLATGKPRTLRGAALVTDIFDVGETKEIVAVLGGVCMLETPMEVTKHASMNTGAVFLLQPGVEQTARQSAATCGGTLHSNFLAYAPSRWRVWPVSDQVLHDLGSVPTPLHMPAERKHAAAAGVDIRIIDSLSEVIPTFLDQDPAESLVAAAEPTSVSRGAQSSHDLRVGGGIADAFRALQQLSQIGKPLAGGIVTHSYDPFLCAGSFATQKRSEAFCIVEYWAGVGRAILVRQGRGLYHYKGKRGRRVTAICRCAKRRSCQTRFVGSLL